MSVIVVLLVLGAFGCLGVSVFLGIFFLRLPAPESRTVNWRQVAKKLRADLSTSGWWRATPAMSIEYREARVKVAIQPVQGVEWTRLTLRHSPMAAAATIGSSDLLSASPGQPPAINLPLLPDLETAGWIGRTPDAVLAARWITPAVQAQLVQLYQAVRPYRVQLLADEGLLQIDVDHPLWAFDSLQQLIRTGLAIYDLFLLTAAEGIAFIEPEVVQPLEAVSCRVCGEPIVRELVVCRACKTPHHRECWEYVGQCSTYACGERIYVIPHTANSPHPP